MDSKTKNRKVYIDFLKTIAIYMVLFNHTKTDGYVLFTVARSSRLYPLYLFNAIFIKIAVPLFFMMSGALLLGREESYRDLLTKRFFKYMVILLVGSAIAYIYDCLRINPQELSLIQFIEKVYTTNISVAYWYLYAYLAYILLIPLIRKMAKFMTSAEYKWMLLMLGLIRCFSIIDFLIWKGKKTYNSSFYFFITTNYVFYPLMGYYIDQRMKKEEFTKKKALILIAASIIAITVSCIMTHYKSTLYDEWTEGSCQTFFNTLIFLPTIAVYYLVKMWFMNHNLSNRVCNTITTIGGTTFGIYLIEQICRNETKFIFNWLKPYIHTLPACWIWILFACMVGSISTLLIKQIPGIKNYI